MGMYTQLSFYAKLRKDTPEQVIQTMFHLLNIKEIENPLFKASSGRCVLIGGSAYFDETYFNVSFRKGHWIFKTQSNIKNYEDELQQFINWIKPFVLKGMFDSGSFAMTLYEEDEIPILFYIEEI